MKAQEQCEKIIESLIAQGYRHQISHRDLVKTIMEHRGVDDRTHQRWIKALLTFGYLKQETTAIHKIYKLNPLKIPRLATLLKEQPQTKMM